MWPRRAGLILMMFFVPHNLLAASFTTYQHDQYSEDLATAVYQISGAHLSAQPGFAQGEAFGQLFRPAPDDYPIRITGIDLILAGPASGGAASADIEIWLDAGDGPTPNKSAPDFTINTVDLLNSETGEFDVNLMGNVASRLDFDYDAADSHPPHAYSGNIWVMIRYTEPAQDLSDAWGNLACSTLIGCGCQQVAPFEDEVMTSGVNILNTYAFGSCEEPNASQWNFSETVGLGGDFIMRLRAETSGTTGGGDTGNNGGDDNSGDDETTLGLSAISPGFGASDTATQVSIVGDGFVEGTTAKLGATDLTDISVTGSQLISATVPAGMEPGQYMLVVLNPDATSAFLTDAFEVQNAAETQDTGDDTADDNTAPQDDSDTDEPGDTPDENTEDTGSGDGETTDEPDGGQPESGGCTASPTAPLGFILLMLGYCTRKKRHTI